MDIKGISWCVMLPSSKISFAVVVLFFFPIGKQWWLWSWFCNPKGQLRTSCTMDKPSAPELFLWPSITCVFRFVCLFLFKENAVSW